jgi:hypothetical protein
VSVAQLVEHRSPKPAVGGSIPSRHALGWWRNWLAHRTVTAVVAGSSPVHPVH